MKFFEDLSAKITDLGQTAVDKTKSFASRTKLSAQLSGEKSALEELYRRIGEKFYAESREGTNGSFEELFEAVGQKIAYIDSLQRQIRDLKGVNVCHKCGAEVDADVNFCPKCGCKIEKPEPKPEPEKDTETVETVCESAPEAEK